MFPPTERGTGGDQYGQQLRRRFKPRARLLLALGLAFILLASATIVAMDKGRPGERYLLGGPNWTTEEFFGRLARVAKVGKPRLKLPGRWAELGAGMLEHVYRARGKEPPVDRQSVEMANHFWWVDSSKAESELGFEQRDLGVRG